jgi:glutathione peroxidase
MTIGKVTIIVNVASQCGYTESHYRGLVNLWSKVKDESVEILAFPCNQFGYQEPESEANILRFAKAKGVEFTMMSKINVNGPTASLVYKYLKKAAGPASITWNFGTSLVCLFHCVSSQNRKLTIPGMHYFHL